MRKLVCPYLQGEVELNDERESHILATHPELGADVAQFVAKTLEDPDEVRSDTRFPNSHLFPVVQ